MYCGTAGLLRNLLSLGTERRKDDSETMDMALRSLGSSSSRDLSSVGVFDRVCIRRRIAISQI